ncbi:zinc finger CCCH domain-containing protein 17 [Tanacetum coccineum]
MVGDGPTTITTEEDEFLKRNTDCVYFLASPLTCKKGSECEYRHSEIARLNPRDCYYWLSGNCLNPKCAFRHPPLDGLLGAEVPAFAGPPVPPAPGKQGVACYYFQKGFCSKGPLCPFLHGPPSIAAQPTPPNPVTKPSEVPSTGPEKPAQEQKFTQHESIQKPVEFHPSHGKYVPGVQARAPTRNGGNVAMEKKVEPPPQETSRYTPANVAPPPVINEVPISRSNHGVYEANHTSDNEGTNGKDVDEYSREPTPGFDVLVDTEAGESEYYPHEEQFGRSRGDYDVDREMHPKQRDYDHYNDEGRLWEEHRESSSFGRKRYPRDESPDQFEHSDLRHRLSKQRRGNDNLGALRSVVSREHPRDNYNDRMPRRDIHHNRHGHHHHHHHHERHMEPGSFSSRLRGRINITGNETGSRVEREVDMGRQHRSRYSPGRPPYTSSNDSRLRDRIKGSRTSNDFDNDRRNYRGSHVYENYKELSRPRRLSELSTQQTNDGQLLGKRKYPRAESQQSEVNASFEGPKPLSEILKRKRGGLVISSVVNNENSNSNENNGHNQEERKESPSENMVNAENGKSTNGQSSLNNKVGSVDEDAMVDQELEAYDSKEGDYDYEQIDGEEYYEEGDEEYIEE